ncbi:MAG: ester cyclase [Halofilum sp. (in: g-proteobacteria)]|nr:ester cyclase [Halofilum sp. (in: g-proteobacteria)]
MHPVRRTVADTTRRLIHRFYHHFWNGRHYEAADRLMAPRGVLRGTLSTSQEQGPEGLVRYARRLTRAFPDVEMQVHELIVERDRAAARVTCTGTHRGEVFGHAGTGRRVRYDCFVLFRVARGRITEVRVHSDRGELEDQLGGPGDDTRSH